MVPPRNQGAAVCASYLKRGSCRRWEELGHCPWDHPPPGAPPERRPALEGRPGALTPFVQWRRARKPSRSSRRLASGRSSASERWQPPARQRLPAGQQAQYAYPSRPALAAHFGQRGAATLGMEEPESPWAALAKALEQSRGPATSPTAVAPLCPSAHPMTSLGEGRPQTYRGSPACDRCRRVGLERLGGWHCGQCRYDLCLACAQERETANTLLLSSSKRGHSAAVRQALERGACVNTMSRDGKGETPLIRASLVHQPAVVRVLLTAKASANLPTRSGDSPLMAAALGGSLEIVRLCLAARADVSAVNHAGLQAVHYAAGRGNLSVIQALVEARARLDSTNGSASVLCSAAGSGSAVVVEWLLGQRVGLEWQDKNNWSALFFASANGREDVVRLLLSSRADLTCRDVKNRSASEVAEASFKDFERRRKNFRNEAEYEELSQRMRSCVNIAQLIRNAT